MHNIQLLYNYSFYLQVDVVLPLDPEEAFPDNEEAQEIWQKYVDAQSPRLSAGNDFTYNSRTYTWHK